MTIRARRRTTSAGDDLESLSDSELDDLYFFGTRPGSDELATLAEMHAAGELLKRRGVLGKPAA